MAIRKNLKKGKVGQEMGGKETHWLYLDCTENVRQ
jgi:hypothetical protein